ncbi:Argonaute-like protein [Mycena indigotica]|uniref:Argonaute-like protein n=1 Tax=Mycena indigotica TaxID=2126181 RepID=A0A8H6S9H4_9AGAR|nr:Argonaute-like protein [Mycena indigotica]KAF7295303.1 Argonaute-like protein [Mycena indigotica]
MATSLVVTTNSFVISQLPQVSFHQYEAFSPDIPVASKRESAINKLQVLYPNIFHPRGVFNGKEHLYMPFALQLPSGRGAFDVYLGEKSPPPPPGGRGSYRVTISRTGAEAISPGQIPALVASGPTFDRDKLATATTVLQLLIRQSIHENNPTHTKRAFFGSEGKKVLAKDGIELWRGFFHSVRALLVSTSKGMMGQMVVTVNTTMTAMLYTGPGSILDLAMTIFDARNVRELSDKRLFHKLKAHFLRRRITTRRMGRDQQTRFVYEIIPGPVGSYSFTKDGRTIELAEYYFLTYNITLQYPNSFGVQVSGENAPFIVILPAELCFLIPGQLYKRRIPVTASAEAVRFATQSSDARLRAIKGRDMSGAQSPILSYNQSQYVVQAGMRIDMQPKTIAAKQLPHPKMIFGRGSSLSPRDGSWNVLGKQFESPARMDNWAVVNLLKEDIIRVVRALMEACQQTATQECVQSLVPINFSTLIFGIEITAKPLISTGNPQNVEPALDEVFSRLRGNVDLIVVILPSSADSVKHQIKYWGNIRYGIPTQCLRQGKVKADSQYLNNVAIKINARLGGRYALPEADVLKVLQSNNSIAPMMVIGADVSHPAPGAHQPSFAGLVYSTDREATRYSALTAVQAPRVEEIQDLKAMMKAAILNFGANQNPPRSILFLRDGVSEGEMDHVSRTEIRAIHDACAEVWAEKGATGPLPRITFIVVVKRHHQRFFPNQQQDADKKGNTRAGLCVEEFRSPLGLDFFLQSHAAIQGTPRPAHYTVLRDDIFGSNVANIQTVCFELCHVYAKATRSVSTPAPVYYADLLCSQAKYRFPPGFDFDAESTSSGSSFDLNLWKSRFGDVSRREVRPHVSFSRTLWFL